LGIFCAMGIFTTPAVLITLGILLFKDFLVWKFSMIFISIALVFGSGRVLSVDYYLVPKLKNLWKKIPCVKKFYLYND
ncbi:MAG: hypothetical protein ACRCSK_05275, partial [Fusobacteriaceae bacterium]